jgi:hypothetical protein
MGGPCAPSSGKVDEVLASMYPERQFAFTQSAEGEAAFGNVHATASILSILTPRQLCFCSRNEVPVSEFASEAMYVEQCERVRGR